MPKQKHAIHALQFASVDTMQFFVLESSNLLVQFRNHDHDSQIASVSFGGITQFHRRYKLTPNRSWIQQRPYQLQSLAPPLSAASWINMRTEGPPSSVAQTWFIVNCTGLIHWTRGFEISVSFKQWSKERPSTLYGKMLDFKPSNFSVSTPCTLCLDTIKASGSWTRWSKTQNHFCEGITRVQFVEPISRPRSSAN